MLLTEANDIDDRNSYDDFSPLEYGMDQQKSEIPHPVSKFDSVAAAAQKPALNFVDKNLYESSIPAGSYVSQVQSISTNQLVKNNANQGFNGTNDRFGEPDEPEDEEDEAELRIFVLPDLDERFNRVQIYGSMDNWREMPDLQYDNSTGKWFIYTPVNPGTEHQYKFLVNGGRWIVNDEVPSTVDPQNGQLNICVVAVQQLN